MSPTLGDLCGHAGTALRDYAKEDLTSAGDDSARTSAFVLRLSLVLDGHAIYQIGAGASGMLVGLYVADLAARGAPIGGGLVGTLAVPRELQTLSAWIACVADARPLDDYTELLTEAGLRIDVAERHDDALLEMVRLITGKLMVAEVATGLKKTDLPGVDFAAAKEMAKAARAGIQRGQFGYALLTAEKPSITAFRRR